MVCQANVADLKTGSQIHGIKPLIQCRVKQAGRATVKMISKSKQCVVSWRNWPYVTWKFMETIWKPYLWKILEAWFWIWWISCACYKRIQHRLLLCSWDFWANPRNQPPPENWWVSPRTQKVEGSSINKNMYGFELQCYLWRVQNPQGRPSILAGWEGISQNGFQSININPQYLNITLMT